MSTIHGLKLVKKRLKIGTKGKQCENITRKVEAVLSESGLLEGVCHVFVQHTSASLMVQENADNDVLRDLESFMSKLVSEDQFYLHSAEGRDDMPAHIRSVLTQVNLSIPFSQGRLALGLWQGIFLWEHRSKGQARELLIDILGG